MSEILIFVGILVGFFVLFFGNYATFAWVVLRWAKKPTKKRVKGEVKLIQPNLTVGEKIRCCIPVWQVYEVRKALYGSAPVVFWSTVISSVLMVFNLVISYIIPINGYVMLFAHVCFIIGFIVAWITAGFVTFDCARMYEFRGFISTMNFILPHIFCFYIKNNIPHIMADMRKKKTFEADDSTIIKQKHSK